MLHSHYKGFLEAGVDEAGRGCLAGPVTAAAVILPMDFYDNNINDSKQLSHKKRMLLREIIQLKAVSFAVEHVYPEKIDQINILNASILAMHFSLDNLSLSPDFIIIDGNRFKPYKDIPYQCIVKGDSKYSSIAAASILAKTYRDEYMMKIHQQYPMYGWDKNKGYPTAEHRRAIAKYGITEYHRTTFQLLPTLKLDFE